jgi:predicted PurR-regulated permease PerM
MLPPACSAAGRRVGEMTERIRRAGAVAWAVLGLAALLALILFLGWVVRVIWPPLILAGAIVFLLNPVVTRIQRHSVPRALATAASYLAVAGVIVLTGLLVAPLARHQYDDLANEWPRIRADLEDRLDELATKSDKDNWFIVVPTSAELEDAIGGSGSNATVPELDANSDGTITQAERDAVADARQKRFADQLATVRELALKVFHVGIIFVLAPIIAFYLLVDLPHLRRVAKSLVPERARPDVAVLAHRLNRAIGGYFRGQLAIALIVGTMASIGLAIIGLPFWIIVGMIAGLFNMIPLIGPWVGAVPGIAIAFTVGSGVSQAIGVAIVMATAQQIDNHFISPLVMSRAVKLHPAVVMLALLAGGTLGGFFGLLLAVPVTAVLKILVGHAWRTYVLGEPIEALASEWEVDDAERGGIVEAVGDDDDAGGTATDESAPAGIGADPSD